MADSRVTTLIADDESVARVGLRDLLAAVPWIEVIGEAASGPAAVEAIDALRPELVFLDIRMPGLLGTEVLGRTHHQPYLVFTTAYAEHAVTAFELGALDYLLKPFGAARLATTLDRVRTALGETPGPAPLDRVHEAMGQGPITRLFVRVGGAVLPIPVAMVTWFEARGDYVAAHVGSARHLLHLSLHRLEARLDPKHFFRLHRAHIVNLDRVTAFRRGGNGQLVAELDDGTRLAVSRARGREVRRLGR